MPKLFFNGSGDNNRGKKVVIPIVACALVIAIVATVFMVFLSCKPAKSADTSTVELQTQINDLSVKVAAFNNAVSQMQSAAASTSSANQPSSSEIDSVKASVKKLSTTVDSLQSLVEALQVSLQGASTSIGVTPVTVNGLSVAFITNSIVIGATGSSTPGSAQFAIKIINTTSSPISNIDVTGIITASQSLSGVMASGYPQVTDGAGLCTYTYYNYLAKDSSGAKTLNFEAYGGSKTSLSILAGGSITLRPKVTILAMPTYQVLATTFTISLNTITYDVVATK